MFSFNVRQLNVPSNPEIAPRLLELPPEILELVLQKVDWNDVCDALSYTSRTLFKALRQVRTWSVVDFNEGCYGLREVDAICRAASRTCEKLVPLSVGSDDVPLSSVFFATTMLKYRWPCVKELHLIEARVTGYDQEAFYRALTNGHFPEVTFLVFSVGGEVYLSDLDEMPRVQKLERLHLFVEGVARTGIIPANLPFFNPFGALKELHLILIRHGLAGSAISGQTPVNQRHHRMLWACCGS